MICSDVCVGMPISNNGVILRLPPTTPTTSALNSNGSKRWLETTRLAFTFFSLLFAEDPTGFSGKQCFCLVVVFEGMQRVLSHQSANICETNMWSKWVKMMKQTRCTSCRWLQKNASAWSSLRHSELCGKVMWKPTAVVHGHGVHHGPIRVMSIFSHFGLHLGSLISSNSSMSIWINK